MKKTQTEDSNVLVQNYQKTNQLLINRSIVMAVLFILVFGIQSSKIRSDQKRIGLNNAIFNLNAVIVCGDLKYGLDSLKTTILWDYYSVATQNELDKLDYDLSKSNYKDATPIYELISEYEKQLKDLGLTSKEYDISVLGLNSSFSTWFYFAPIILLILYHDMTRTILYRASLRKKIKLLQVEQLKVGSEIFGTDRSLDMKPTNRFMFMITNLLVSVLIFLPLIPVFIAAISYLSENRQSDINGFMVFVQWISPLIMTVELILVYYTENLLGARKIVTWAKRKITAWPTKLNIFITKGLSILITILMGFIVILFHGFHISGFLVIIAALISTALLPVGSQLLLKYPEKYVFRGVRMVGRVMLLFWLYALYDFDYKIDIPSYNYLEPYFPIEFWVYGTAIMLSVSTCLATIYIWVFRGKYKRLQQWLQYRKEKEKLKSRKQQMYNRHSYERA